jgi:hypothetical protein
MPRDNFARARRLQLAERLPEALVLADARVVLDNHAEYFRAMALSFFINRGTATAGSSRASYSSAR